MPIKEQWRHYELFLASRERLFGGVYANSFKEWLELFRMYWEQWRAYQFRRFLDN